MPVTLVLGGQLSSGDTCPGGTLVQGDNCPGGQMPGGQMSGGHLSGGEMSHHPACCLQGYLSFLGGSDFDQMGTRN